LGGARISFNQGEKMSAVKCWAIVGTILAALVSAFVPTASAASDPVVLRIYTAAPVRPSAATEKPANNGQSGTLAAAFNMTFLKSLPQHTFVSQTPWYKKPVKFTGPLLRDVLTAAKVKGTVIHATALDEYGAQIPFSDAQQYDMILAHQMDGETLTTKNKGPLFMVYPYDSRPELQAIRFYERSIWQLKALQVD
jgi:hypothetical protein